MQSENRFFDDLGKIINGAAGTIAGVGREFEANAREKAKQWMSGMDFVSREEFEAVKAMAAKYGAKIRAIAGNILRNQPMVPAVPPAVQPPPPADENP